MKNEKNIFLFYLSKKKNSNKSFEHNRYDTYSIKEKIG